MRLPVKNIYHARYFSSTITQNYCLLQGLLTRWDGPPMEGKILVVDDEEGIRNSLGEYLTRQGFTALMAEDGGKALEEIRTKKPDIIVLDVQLPSMDGWEICKKIRQETGHSIGIIMISGIRKETVDKVVGLELGADVYITKPFERSELGAQVKALLRRIQSQKQLAQDRWLTIDDRFRINFERRMVEVGSIEIHITKLEFDLLQYLAERQGRPVGRSELMDKVWGYDEGVSEAAVNVRDN